MKFTLSFLFAALLTGFVASWYSLKESRDSNATTFSRLQDDLLAADARLHALLKHTEENAVELRLLECLWKEEGIAVVVYDNGKATTWSTNAVPFPAVTARRSSPPEGVQRLRNAWYLCRSIELEGQSLAAFALIHTDLHFQNEHIRNTWGPLFKNAGEYRLTLSDIGASVLLFADGSDAIFVRQNGLTVGQHSYLAPLLWLVLLVLVLATLWFAANWLTGFGNRWLGTAFLFVALFICRVFMLWWQLPQTLYEMELFGPTLHATSALLPSLGDFLLHLVFLLLFIFRLMQVHAPKERSSKVVIWLAVIVPILLVWPVHYCYQTVVFNSSFSLDLNNPFSLDLYSILGLFTTFLVLVNFLLLSRYLFGFIAPDQRRIVSIWPGWLVGTGVLYFSLGATTDSLLIALAGGITVGFLVLTEKWTERMRDVSLYTPTILVFAVFATVLLSLELEHEERESRRALARNVALQQNPITEYLFDDLEERIVSDRTIRSVLSKLPLEQSSVLEAIHVPLNYDHWNQYRGVINLFDDEGRLLVSDEERTGPNYHELQRSFETAKPTISEHIHYVGHLNEAGGYLARITLKGNRSQSDLVLFIRLIPERTEDIIGFTDLLIDEGISHAKALEGYSFARYEGGELQRKQGDYPYGLRDDMYEGQRSEYQFMTLDDFDHLVYRPMEDSLVVISKPKQGAISYLTIFSYLFLFYFACALVFVIAEGRLLYSIRQGRSFRSRINLAMTSVLFVSLLLIGLLTVFYVIKEYNARNEEMISEKSRSVLIELEHKLRDRSGFGEEDHPMLSALLIKFSKVFFTDINLYHLDGHLLATSRPRIFDEGFMAKVMEPKAYGEMRFNQRSSFIQQETIGSLTYLTAYVPFRNENREVVAFMSLPYFARQHGLQQEIFSLLAALTNIYVFLILISVVLALVISNRITEPLRFIRESLKNLKLDQTNRAIEWDSNDEIGELVKEYNRTLNELVQSAELLARSERESAWREMAKQVAHEIKNPLTPMKLSVQMLQRSLADGATDMNERVERMAQTLIAQIDTLSNIATEFSTFAQMPKPHVENVNLQALLENAAELHGNTDVEIQLDILAEMPSIIQADKEQVLRVFNNLIKNGIQAVPEDRKGQIKLGLIKDGQRWVASVQDNGSGIPDDLADKIFIPNFTTKSAGMGLGLAMVKNIVETVNGKIWFKTEANVGTTFYISFPSV